MRVANARERERMAEVGRQLVELMRPLIDEHGGGEVSDEDWSDAFGKLLLSAALVAGEDEVRLNRVRMIVGIGHALGELAASWPAASDGLRNGLNLGAAAGYKATVAAMTPQGNA